MKPVKNTSCIIRHFYCTPVNVDKDDIKLSDWQRILLGNAPVEFLAEVAIRTIIIFILLLICVHLMGKRMAGNISKICTAYRKKDPCLEVVTSGSDEVNKCLKITGRFLKN